MKELHLDTNFLIRLFARDDGPQVAIVQDLLRSAAAGECRLLLSEAVVAEVVWVLRSSFGTARSDVASLLNTFVRSPGVICDGRDRLLHALRIYRTSGLDAVDCLLAAAASSDGRTLATFDRDLRRMPGFEVHPSRG